MNKTELIAATARATGMTQKDSERFLNMVLEIVTDTLAQGEKVQISGFGTFEIRHREARTARTLRTKESLEVPAVNVPTFKASTALKDAVEK